MQGSQHLRRTTALDAVDRRGDGRIGIHPGGKIHGEGVPGLGKVAQRLGLGEGEVGGLDLGRKVVLGLPPRGDNRFAGGGCRQRR